MKGKDMGCLVMIAGFVVMFSYNIWLGFIIFVVGIFGED